MSYTAKQKGNYGEQNIVFAIMECGGLVEEADVYLKTTQACIVTDTRGLYEGVPGAQG